MRFSLSPSLARDVRNQCQRLLDGVSAGEVESVLTAVEDMPEYMRHFYGPLVSSRIVTLTDAQVQIEITPHQVITLSPIFYTMGEVMAAGAEWRSELTADERAALESIITQINACEEFS